jgi:hypothetical protein
MGGGGTTMTQTPCYSLICSLFNDAVSNRDYIAWHIWMAVNNELERKRNEAAVASCKVLCL